MPIRIKRRMKKFAKNFQKFCVENVTKKTVATFLLIETKQVIETLVLKNDDKNNENVLVTSIFSISIIL